MSREDVGQGDAEGSARIGRSAREGEERERWTKIDGIESERVVGRVEAGGDASVYVCNAVHRTSRSRMEAEEREGGEG